jgi:hypothetical protein
MSRCATRARRRRARYEELRAELASVRNDPEAMFAMFKRVAGSNQRACLLIGLTPKDRRLDDDELAMLLKAVVSALG